MDCTLCNIELIANLFKMYVIFMSVNHIILKKLNLGLRLKKNFTIKTTNLSINSFCITHT